MTCSIWPRSTRTSPRFGSSTVCMWMSSPMRRASIRLRSSTSALTLEDPRLARLPSREGEELPRQPAGVLAGAQNLAHLDPHVVVEPRAREQELAVADDDAEDVVEIVRNAAGEAPDAVHLLRLAQVAFEPPALGDVARGEHEAGNLGPMLQVARRDLDRSATRRRGRGRAPRARGCRRRSPTALTRNDSSRSPSSGCSESRSGRPTSAVGRSPNTRSRRRVGEAHHQSGLEHQHRVRDVLEQQPRALLALAQRFFGVAPLPPLAGALDRRQQLVGRYRLDQVVAAVLAQRAHGAVDRGMAGQNHRLGQLGQRAQAADDVEAVHVGQPQIDQRNGRRTLAVRREVEPFAAARGHERAVAAAPEDVRQRTEQLAVVVDDQDGERFDG